MYPLLRGLVLVHMNKPIIFGAADNGLNSILRDFEPLAGPKLAAYCMDHFVFGVDFHWKDF